MEELSLLPRHYQIEDLNFKLLQTFDLAYIVLTI